MRGWVDDVLLPAVFSSLPSVFPEFGWRGTRGGWRATAEEFVHGRFGCRADRVVCHVPRGLLVHGGESLHWLAYLNGGLFPEGKRWREVVVDLAARVGVDVPSVEEEALRDPIEIAVDQVLTVAQAELGAEALAFLSSRGVTEEVARRLGFGWIETKAKLLARLPLGHGILRAGVLTERPMATSRWDRRVVCPWRDSRGKVVGLWGRTVSGNESSDSESTDCRKYLVSGRRAILWGHDHILSAARRGGTMVAVEGFFDAIALQGAGYAAAALGGAVVGADLLWALERAGVARLVVVLDGDDAGVQGVVKLTETMLRYDGELEVCVVPPALMGGRDPDELVVAGEWAAVYGEAMSWLTLWASTELASVTPASSEATRLVVARRCARVCARVARQMPMEVGEVGRQIESATGIRSEFFEVATAAM